MLKKISDKARNKMYFRTMVREYIDSGICPWCGEDLIVSAENTVLNHKDAKCPKGCDIHSIEEVI